MSHLAHSSSAMPRSVHWADDTPVIQGRRKRDDMSDSPVPTFGQDKWDLIAFAFRNNKDRSRNLLDFTRFADPARRVTAKELMMQRLNRPVATEQGRKAVIGVETAFTAIHYLQALYEFMDQRGVATLTALTQDDLNAYLRSMVADGVDPAYMAEKLRVSAWLHEARDMLTCDHIVFAPWGGRSMRKVVGLGGRRENKTPRVPEETMGPLLRWSLAYVERFADDIISAYGDLLADAQPPRSGRLPNGTAAGRLAALFDARRRKGRPLPCQPGAPGEPGINQIARLAGVPPGAVAKNRVLLMAAIEELGLEPGGLDTEVSVLPETGRPWWPGFHPLDVREECKRLIAACYVVCAYLSGMRDSEVQAIRRGAYRPTLDAQGEVVRHKVESTEFKGERGEEGRQRTWVVVEPVARAIAVLERLTEALHAETGCEFLFVHLWGADPGNPSLKRQANYYVASFVAAVNTEIQPRLADAGLPPIPMGTADDPLRITTRMFRRTVAWHIANRPFGVVAGMIQYGHATEVTFEGYAGTSTSGFRAEVEAERETARRMDILDMYEDHKRGVRPAGPMAEELDGEFRAIREELGDFPGKVVDERRREKMLEHLRVRLHPGLMADCFFEAKEASCLRHLAEKERAAPVAGICDSRCPNACWLKKHLAVWEGALADVRRLAKRNRISPIQRDILRDKAKDYEAIINDIKEASHGGQQKER